MVVIMVSLAKREEGDKPAVTAGVSVSMWLVSPDMADGINKKRRVEY